MSVSIPNDGTNHGLYVWRDPVRSGHPIAEAELQQVISFAQQHGIKRILYDNWGTGLNCKKDKTWSLGSGIQTDWFLNELISKAHEENISIESLYTDHLRFLNVIGYNSKNQNKFDGIRMNYEGPWNLGNIPSPDETFREPVSSGDIDYFAIAKRRISNFIPSWFKQNAEWWAAGLIDDNSFFQGLYYLINMGIIGINPDNDNLPLYASISWHWGRTDTPDPDQPIEYNGNQKFAYEHILDIVDGVDIQTAWGVPENAVNEIVFRTKPIIDYARSIGKPAWITLETSDRVSGNGTFNGQPIDDMENTAQDILTALNDQNCMPAGIIYHFYKNSYG